MSATGLDVFDKTLQTTHIWLNDITEVIGPDKQVAWHVLGAVLRTLRDRVPLQVAAHLGAELPLRCGASTTISGTRPTSPSAIAPLTSFWAASPNSSARSDLSSQLRRPGPYLAY